MGRQVWEKGDQTSSAPDAQLRRETLQFLIWRVNPVNPAESNFTMFQSLQQNCTPEPITSRSISAKFKNLRTHVWQDKQESALTYRPGSVSDFPGDRVCVSSNGGNRLVTLKSRCQRKKKKKKQSDRGLINYDTVKQDNTGRVLSK